MLYDLDNKLLKTIPQLEEYQRWRARLSEKDYREIIAWLHQLMERQNFFIASQIPGKDRAGTPYEPILEACERDENQAKLFFSLLVWDAVMQHPDDWHFARHELELPEFLGLIYYRKKLI
jgi:hypothetical protein